MALALASLIHGHSMHIEYPDRLASMSRKGMHIEVVGKPGTSNWFHFAIPTPVILNDRRLKGGSAMLSFRTLSTEATVTSVHIFGGENRIAQHSNLNMTGDHLFERFDIPGDPDLSYAVGVSIGVSFGSGSMNHGMQFIWAGCDFLS